MAGAVEEKVLIFRGPETRLVLGKQKVRRRQNDSILQSAPTEADWSFITGFNRSRVGPRFS